MRTITFLLAAFIVIVLAGCERIDYEKQKDWWVTGEDYRLMGTTNFTFYKSDMLGSKAAAEALREMLRIHQTTTQEYYVNWNWNSQK